MPVVTVNMIEGRTEKQKSDLAAGITDVLVNSAGASRESVVVLINELPKHCVARGGKLKSSHITEGATPS